MQVNAISAIYIHRNAVSAGTGNSLVCLQGLLLRDKYNAFSISINTGPYCTGYDNNLIH